MQLKVSKPARKIAQKASLGETPPLAHSETTIQTDSAEIRIEMVLTGVTPLMFNPKNDAISEKEMTPEQQAGMKVPKDESGRTGVPAVMLYRCWVGGGTHTTVKLVGSKTSRALTSSKGSSQVGSFISFEDIFFPFLDQKAGWVTSTMRFNAKMADGKVASKETHRPQFSKWAIRVVAILDNAELSEKEFKLLVERSGKRVGLGAYSPRSSGWFGKYKISQWKIC